MSKGSGGVITKEDTEKVKISIDGKSEIIEMKIIK
jgi:hypothetical protein